MPDTQLILIALQRVHHRLWANRFFAEISRVLFAFLIFLAAFKILDLFNPFKAGTVIFVIVVWLFALSGYSYRILRRRQTLAESAVSIDRRLRLHDEITTAYWFIKNPIASPWVDGQIQRAARSVQQLDINRVYPRVLPKAFYYAVSVFILIAALNFSPLSTNHNWFALEAAPANPLTADEKDLFQQAQDLLLRNNDPTSAGKLREIARQLEAGDIDITTALQQISDIRAALEEGKLDLDSILAGLEEIARDFAQSGQLRNAAGVLHEQKLPEAAQELRDVATKIKGINSPDLAEMRESLEKASGHVRPGLEDISQHLNDAVRGLRDENFENTANGLIHTAQDLEQLALQIEIQQLENTASEVLERLEQAIRRRDGEGSGQQDGQAAGWDTELPDDRGAIYGMPPGNEAHGLEPSGEAIANPVREGRSTSLRVQLQQERIAGQRDLGIPDAPKEVTTQERSATDHTNETPDFKPAAKDVVNQKVIPWDYRQLIKTYFESIHHQSDAAGRR